MSWADCAAAHLENEYVMLRPIQPDDRSALRAIAMDQEIWRYFVTRAENDAEFDAFFEATLDDHRTGRRAVYLITDKGRAAAAGSMSFGNMAPSERRLEVGWSWLGAEFRGRNINHWAKYLLLEHAFERMDAERVEFKTDVLNTRARRALLKIGAVEEGTLRSFNYMPGGRRRDAVFYSVLRHEWPQVRRRLQAGRAVRPDTRPSGVAV
jgi:RimJ/RimL family protein N-acetyltransferase